MTTRTYKEEKAQAIAFLENIRKNNFKEALKIILGNEINPAGVFWQLISKLIKRNDILFLNKFLDFCVSNNLDAVSYHILQSILLIKNGKYEEALSLLLKASQIDHKNIILMISISGVYSKLKIYDKALEYSNKALQLEPTFIRSYIGMGFIYNKLKDHTKAIEYFNKAILIDPDYADSFENLGNVYYNLKEYDKAIEYYNKAILLDSESADNFNNLGNVYYY